MTRTITIPVTDLTHEGFAPFGQVIGPLPGKPAWERPRLTSWRMDFSSDGPVDLKFIRYHVQPMEFHMMERHLNHTETRIPVKGGRFIMVVAASSDDMTRPVAPDPESVRAFLIDGSVGILIWKGTWHSLDTYPAGDTDVEVAFLSEKGTQAEIEVPKFDPDTAKLTHIADFSTKGIQFRLDDKG